MTTLDFIIEQFCRIDDRMQDVPKHNQAKLYPSEIVTLGMLFALKGVGDRTFYRWVKRDWTALFFRICPIAPACFGCSASIRTGRTAFWPSRR